MVDTFEGSGGKPYKWQRVHLALPSNPLATYPDTDILGLWHGAVVVCEGAPFLAAALDAAVGLQHGSPFHLLRGARPSLMLIPHSDGLKMLCGGLLHRLWPRCMWAVP